MPTGPEILAGAAAIANEAIVIAILWHVVLALALAALLLGWRPAQSTVRTLLAVPLVSVAAFALAFGNPFNGTVFAVAVVGLALLGRDSGAVARGAPLLTLVGVVAIAYAWVYPHFLDAPAYAYLFAAPVGLLPCPTLALVVGVTLLGGGLGSRAWSGVIAALALIYGVIGVARLGVVLDLGLIAFALVLGAMVTFPRAAPSPWHARTHS